MKSKNQRSLYNMKNGNGSIFFNSGKNRREYVSSLIDEYVKGIQDIDSNDNNAVENGTDNANNSTDIGDEFFDNLYDFLTGDDDTEDVNSESPEGVFIPYLSFPRTLIHDISYAVNLSETMLGAELLNNGWRGGQIFSIEMFSEEVRLRPGVPQMFFFDTSDFEMYV